MAEGNGLLNRRRGKTSTEGSNPSLSATGCFEGSLRGWMSRQLDFYRLILYQRFALLTVNRAEVAQLVEHSPEKAGVDSSILSLGTTFPLLTRF